MPHVERGSTWRRATPATATAAAAAAAAAATAAAVLSILKGFRYRDAA